jgi:hypothetical protein
MKRVALVLGLLTMAALTAGGAGAAESRHSGRIVAVDPAAGTLRVQEMVAWTGPGTGLVERTIRLAPQTSIALVRRAREIDPARWPNAFDERRAGVEALRPGEFVTVTTGDGDVAEKVEVVEPDAA